MSAIAVLLAGAAVLSLFELGPLSALMAQHLLLMNVVAPLAATWLAPMLGGSADRDRFLYGAGLAQMLLLWAWHLPLLHRALVLLPGLDLALQAFLFAVAVLFWAMLVRAGSNGRWSAVAMLLMTGKLACLLGALLILAPRVLYPLEGLASAICGVKGPMTLADQHLAGLLMIVACPLSYVVAGVVMAAQMLADLEHRSRPYADPRQGLAP
jgi:putative membrane protein